MDVASSSKASKDAVEANPADHPYFGDSPGYFDAKGISYVDYDVQQEKTRMMTQHYKSCHKWGINPDAEGRPNNSITGWALSGCEKQTIAEHYRDLNSNGDQVNAPARDHVLPRNDTTPRPYPFLDGEPPRITSEAVMKAAHDGDTTYAFVKPVAETLPEMNVTPALRFACHTFYSFLPDKMKERVNDMVSQSLPLKDEPTKPCQCGDSAFNDRYAAEVKKIRVERSVEPNTPEKITVYSPHAIHLQTNMTDALMTGDPINGGLGVKYLIGNCKSCGDVTGCHNPLINAKLFFSPVNYALWAGRMSGDIVCGLEIVRWFAYVDWQRDLDTKSGQQLSRKELCARATGKLPDGGTSTLILNAKPDQLTTKFTAEQEKLIGEYCKTYGIACDYTPGFCKACGERVGAMNPALDMKRASSKEDWEYMVTGQKQNPTICAKELADSQITRNQRSAEYSSAPACNKPRVEDLRPTSCPNYPLTRYSFRFPFEVKDADGRVFKLQEGEPEWTKLPAKCIKIVICFASQWAAMQGVEGMLADDPARKKGKKKGVVKKKGKGKAAEGEVGLAEGGGKIDVKGKDKAVEGINGQEAEYEYGEASDVAGPVKPVLPLRSKRRTAARGPIPPFTPPFDLSNGQPFNLPHLTKFDPNATPEQFKKQLEAGAKEALAKAGLSDKAVMRDVPMDEVEKMMGAMRAAKR